MTDDVRNPQQFTYTDVVQAIREGRTKICSDCANTHGGFDAGYRNCDDGAAIKCPECGKTARPVINARYTESR